MRRTRIKICGVSTIATALAAAEAGADAVGMVFVKGSPREVSLAMARSIVQVLPAFVEPVGLFANASPADVLDIARHLGIRTVQLHGRETAEDVAALSPLRVVKAIAFDEQALVGPGSLWRDRPANLAGLLIDTPPPAAAIVTGGHGQPFDWSPLQRLREKGQLIDLPALLLAGGLNADNVGQAIAQVKPYAVDVSSGVESSRGVKDIEKIHAFCEAVRRADAMTRA